MAQAARELEVFIEAHADLAKVALDVLLDGALDLAAKAPVVAAVRYGYDDHDLIHDQIPLYGLIDDVYVLAIGVAQALARGGERCARLRDRKLDGIPLPDLLRRMQAVGGLWRFCEDRTAAFFAHVAQELAANPGSLEEVRDRFVLEIRSLTKKTTHARGALNDAHVAQFLATYRLPG